MLRSPIELIAAAIACTLIGLFYVAVVIWMGEIPAAGEFFGHTLGIIGFLLMLATETLYSLRKRSRLARWGRLVNWLRFHIFTGIVGPFMVFLHSAWKMNGIAGVTLWMTGVVVLSGFIGRYLYTRIPRTADGIEDPGLIGMMQASALANARRLFALWHTIHIPLGMALFVMAFTHICGALYFATLLR